MDAGFILIYVVAQIAIGVWLSRRMKTESDYFLGGRNVGPALLTFSLFATWFGAETCLGSSGQVYAHGISGSRADPFGFTLCLVLMGLLLAARLRAGRYVTLADYFRERYGPLVEKAAVWVMIPSSLIWAAAQLRAFGQIISATTMWPVALTIVLSAVFVIFYTYLGGLLGDIYTDFLQGFMIIMGLVVLGGVVLGDWPQVKETLAGMDPARLSFIAPGESLLERLDRWMVPILGSLVTQELISRILAARTPSIARRASYFAAGLYFLVGVIPVFLGLVGPRLLPGLIDQEQFLVHLSSGLLPRLLFILFAGALISAILSTTDSILLAISALLTHNLVFPLFRVEKEKARVRVARVGVAAAGVTACVIAITGGGIYDLVVTASAFGTAGVLVITLAGLHSRAGGERAALGALVTGLLATLLGQYVLGLPAPFLTAVLAAAAVFGAAAALKW